MRKWLFSSALTLAAASNVFALDGEIIFRDALYGAGIGAIAGGAVYLIDGEDFGAKVGTGVFIGVIAGAAMGVYESQAALVEIKNGKVYAGLPQIKQKAIKLENNKYHLINQLSLVEAKF